MNNENARSRLNPSGTVSPGVELGDRESWTPEGTCADPEDSGEWSLWPDNASREPFVGNPRVGPVEEGERDREHPRGPAEEPRSFRGGGLLSEPDLGNIGRPRGVDFPVGHAIATKAQEAALDIILDTPGDSPKPARIGPPPRVKITGNRCPWGIDISPAQRKLEADYGRKCVEERKSKEAAAKAAKDAEDAARPVPYASHWVQRYGPLVTAVGEAWDWKTARNLEYQGGLLPRLMDASARLSPASWDSCVALMLAKATAPNGVADYLGAICEKRAVLDETAAKALEGRQMGTRTLGCREESRKSWEAHIKMFADRVTAGEEEPTA